jgi:hypothetical protein
VAAASGVLDQDLRGDLTSERAIPSTHRHRLVKADAGDFNIKIRQCGVEFLEACDHDLGGLRFSGFEAISSAIPVALGPARAPRRPPQSDIKTAISAAAAR